MYNLFDYLAWRGDLPVAADGFNDIDAVILSRLSYLPFDGIVSDCFQNYTTVSQAADRMFSEGEPSFLWEGDDRLMKELAQQHHCRLAGGFQPLFHLPARLSV